MNDNSTTAAYLHMPYDCRQREIRTPVLQRHMHELLLPPHITLQPPDPTNQCYHGSQPLYIVISWFKSPRLGLVGYNPLPTQIRTATVDMGPGAVSVCTHVHKRSHSSADTPMRTDRQTYKDTNIYITNSLYFIPKP